MQHISDCFVLNNGVRIPCVAFGTYKAAADQTAAVISRAIEAGYRHFDTASFYGTEPFLGQALAACGLPREDFFLTSKAWKDEMGYEEVKAAFARSLERLGTDYLDLYLIHWPRPDRGTPNWEQLCQDTWRALEELYQAGQVRAIGLSNFLPHHIEVIQQSCTVTPMVDQIEFHPGYTQPDTVHYCQAHGIQVEAWSPMGRTRVLDTPLVTELAAKYAVSPSQLCLRYALQKNVLPLPKASSLEHMQQNQDVFAFTLSGADVSRLDTMPQTGWSGQHPDFLE